jgi:hypothetical protein
MKAIDWRTCAARLPIVIAATAAPMAFPLSQMGMGSLHELALKLVIPAALVLIAAFIFLQVGGIPTARLMLVGAGAGAVATLALEAVRYTGFRLGYMPGNLPDLMGVLLLDRFAQGPSAASTLAGFAYHFWNGACFGMIFALLKGKLSNWWALPYGIAVGLGFLVSPVVQALGVGLFGKDFGWHFAATVLTAHAAFGTALGVLLRLRAPRESAASVGSRWRGYNTGSQDLMNPSSRA